MSSPGVSVSYELPDFTAIQTAPQGIPPGIIGSSLEGPAFVPINLGSLTDFENKFGIVSGSHFGTLAVREWYKNHGAVTYLRLLGIGDGARRLTAAGTNSANENLSAGSVVDGGFIVGSQQPRASGFLGNNPSAYAGAGGALGRTYFLGAFMSESADSTVFSSAGIQDGPSSVPILRGVLFAASGVIPSLSGCYTGNASTASVGITTGIFDPGQDGGSTVGSVNLRGSKYTFVMLLNGHSASEAYPNTITASLNPTAVEDSRRLYFSGVFNTNPKHIQDAGYCLYTHYDVWTAQAILTGAGVVTAGTEKSTVFGEDLQDSVFLLTSSMGRNPADTITPEIPNFENFSDRYQAPFSPTVISQKINGIPQDLFSFHVLDDGKPLVESRLKITLANIKPGDTDDDFGEFDVLIRKFNDTDYDPQLIGEGESYTALNLDPSSDSYIARRIGDMHFYYDFDLGSESQKLVKKGLFENRSAYVRVQMNKEVTNKNISKQLLPIGFRGPHHLVTSGSSIMSLPQHPLTDGSVISSATNWSRKLTEIPIPYRENKWTLNSDLTRDSNSLLTWGFMTQRVIAVDDLNASIDINPGVTSYCTYFPNFSTVREPMFAGNNANKPDSDGTVYDSDRFNYNQFSLENVQIHTRSDIDIVDTEEWAFATYRRNGILQRQLKKNATYDTGRFLNVRKDFKANGIYNWLSFTMPIQGGFDGTNIFDANKSGFTNSAATWELDDPLQGGKRGPTLTAYKHALKIISEKTETDIQLLAIPGMRVSYLTNQAIETVEEHFDAMYVMDPEQYDIDNNVVTSSAQTVSIPYTIEALKNRALDSSFTATYFPDVTMFDPSGPGSILTVPPSVAAMYALGNSDHIAGAWAVPAGYTRGKISYPGPAIELRTKYASGSATAVEELYSAGINPFLSQTGHGLLIYGQKTLMTPEVDSALERINIRRLLIDVRRRVRRIANYYLFEQNQEEVLNRFTMAVAPVLQKIQADGGLSRYKISVDTSTTTQIDIENNIVRGKIFLQPIRSEEFVSIDFDTE